jgi:hypothetical protein
MKTFKTPKGTDLPLMDLKGKDYLQPAYRVVWLREEHPDWSVETEFLVMEPEYTIAKATIKDATGRIIATSHKSDNNKQFHLERAETGAIGRCAALCGYGTAFAGDLDEDDNSIADAPLSPAKQSKAWMHTRGTPPTPFKVPEKFTAPELPPMPEDPNTWMSEEPSFDVPFEAPKKQGSQDCPECKKTMMISKYPDPKYPQGFWYCAKCKTKVGV